MFGFLHHQSLEKIIKLYLSQHFKIMLMLKYDFLLV